MNWTAYGFIVVIGLIALLIDRRDRRRRRNAQRKMLRHVETMLPLNPQPQKISGAQLLDWLEKQPPDLRPRCKHGELANKFCNLCFRAANRMDGEP